MVGVLWILVGYTLAFGTGNAFVGDLSKLGLAGIDTSTLWGTYGIPEYVFVMFQAMFAIITPALMIGAFAERMRFGPYLAFITLWLLVVYCPLAHMVWGGGWIGAMGAKDFAGGLVVHMSSGYSALVAAIFLGKRRGFGKEPMPPHNLPFAVIGAGAAVGRLVRLQRRQRADGRRHRRPRLPHHQHRRLDRARHLDGDRVAPPREARPCSARRPRSSRVSWRSRRPARS